jgi:hypothetical protein
MKLDLGEIRNLNSKFGKIIMTEVIQHFTEENSRKILRTDG